MRFAINLCLALLLLVGGCGRGPGPAADAPEDARKTITLWHIITYTDVLDRAVERFEAAHPGVRVEVETIPNDQYKTKLNVEIASGTPPDVFFTWGGGGLAALAEAGRVVDLTERVDAEWKDRFLPAALDFCEHAGRLYAAPLDLSCVPVWYNAEIFEAHGAEPPETYEELLNLCKLFKAQGVTPFALGNRDRWPGAFYFIYLATRLGGRDLFEGAAARDPGKSFAAPAFVEAGERLQGLVDAGFLPVGFSGIDDDAARTRFLEGQAAMYVMGSWLVARVQDDKPAFLDKLKCFPFPAIEGGAGDPGTVLGGVNAGFAVSTACEEKDLAAELLRELTSEATVRDWIGIGRMPALKVDGAALADFPAPTKQAMDILAGAPAIQQYYDQYLPPRLAEVHKDTVQELFAKTLSPADAAAAMERAAGE